MQKHHTENMAGKRGATGQAYALVVGLISIVALGAVTGAGNSANTLFTQTATTLGGPAGTNPSPSPSQSPADDDPDAFDFADNNGASVNALVMSDIVQITGHEGVDVTISGDGSPQFRICDDAACSSEIVGWGSATASLDTDKYVQVRLTSNSSLSVTHTAVLNAGQQSADWAVTTANCSNTSPITYTSSGKTVLSVPSGCTSVTIKAWGGGGGGSGGSSGRGGGGGYASGSFSVTSGESLNIYVGGGGGSVYNTASNHGGGYGGGGGASHYGGGGGGRSLIAKATQPSDPLVIAGGGGGGGYNNGHGGAGGGQDGWGYNVAGAGGKGGASNGNGGVGGVESYYGGNGGSWASGVAGNGGRGSSAQYATGGTPSSQGTSYDQYAYTGGHGADYGGGGGGGSCSGSGSNTAGSGPGGGTVAVYNNCHNPGGGGSAGGGGGGSVHGGGGGGGYGGGGGGAHASGDGGGGGSSYVRSADIIGSPTLTAGNSQVPGNTGDTHYQSPRAYGGSGTDDPGDDGLVVLIFGN